MAVGARGLLVLGLLCAPVAQAQASAWTQPQGTGYLKVYARSLIGRHAYINGRTLVDLSRVYQDHQLNLYGQWGVTDECTAILQATPVGLAHFAGQTDAYVEGATAAMRYRLQLQPVVLSLQLHAGARPPLSRATGEVEIEGRTYELRPVVGTLFGGGSVRAGRSFGDRWLTGSLGVRFHSAATLGTAFFAHLQGGWHATASVTLAAHLNWWHALGALEPVNVLGAGQTRYLGFGASATWWFTPSAGLYGGFDGVVYAYSNAATPSLLLGFEFR